MLISASAYRKERERKSGLVKAEVEIRGPGPARAAQNAPGGQLYEEIIQVEKLRKWAPVRAYYGNLGDGEKGSVGASECCACSRAMASRMKTPSRRNPSR